METEPDKEPLAKLRWRCRRGMRELDALMVGWLERHYKDASQQDINLFLQLLDMQDPELFGLINQTVATTDRNSRPSSALDDAQTTGNDLEADALTQAKDCPHEKILAQICATRSYS